MYITAHKWPSLGNKKSSIHRILYTLYVHYVEYVVLTGILLLLLQLFSVLLLYLSIYLSISLCLSYCISLVCIMQLVRGLLLRAPHFLCINTVQHPHVYVWIWVAKGKGGDGQAGQIWLGMTMYSAHCAVVGVIFHFCGILRRSRQGQ